MRKIIMLIMVFTLLTVFISAPMNTPPAQAELSVACKHALHNPTYAVICFWEFMMAYWNPLDWGDSDTNS